MRRYVLGCCIAALTVSLVACGNGSSGPAGDRPPALEFPTGVVHIETATDTLRLSVEIAETNQQRALGLMERTSLPENAGMIFVYSRPQDADAGFWMYRTRIPLDIAFVDGDGRIVAIRRMEPCESPYAQACPIYSPGVPYSAALEVNAGYFAARGVGVGDRVVLERPGA